MITGVDSNLWEEPLQDAKSIADKQVKTIDDFMNHNPIFKIISRLTVCVTRAGAGGGTPSDWKKAKA
jgi:hypothetical protein